MLSLVFLRYHKLLPIFSLINWYISYNKPVRVITQVIFEKLRWFWIWFWIIMFISMHDYVRLCHANIIDFTYAITLINFLKRDIYIFTFSARNFITLSVLHFINILNLLFANSWNSTKADYLLWSLIISWITWLNEQTI